MDKFIIVVDNANSALATVAKQRQRFHECEVVFACDFDSPIKLLEYIIQSPPIRVLFAWRGALREAIMCKKSQELYFQLSESKTVHLLIPDLLGLHPLNQISEYQLLKTVHGYWVTSFELFHKYSEVFPSRVPLGVLHDLPNVEEILKVREMTLEQTGIVWVGNSKWGSNFGFVDHKGFSEIVKPLSRMFTRDFPFRIIDSASSRLKNLSVLMEIRKSRILIQTSENEGTGLPVLEALGVGTVPVTTKVGIAEEILSGEFSSLIVSKSVSDFYSKIMELGEPSEDFSRSCISLFDAYVFRVASEQIEWTRGAVEFTNDTYSWFVRAETRLKWLIRFFRENCKKKTN
jgi:hypothetical protein